MTQKKRINKLEAKQNKGTQVCFQQRLVEVVDEETVLIGIIVGGREFLMADDENESALYARAREAIAAETGAKCVVILPEYAERL